MIPMLLTLLRLSRVWVHWVLYDNPVSASGLPEGAGGKDLHQGFAGGPERLEKMGYGGPCPPVGWHRYFHRLYALDIVLGDLGRVTKRELRAKIEGQVREAGAVKVCGRNLGLAPGT